eukprot:TRINITY_DN23560_c0_g1_i1.p1 TRINITY_DN23560_c0_g1~~TRINITY_DN23560_c0_g1_i1.p1  ORF type:complete len:332 (+),score=61.66 TRINITY_DN23560_c0_g1_i1:60-1055(+)
MVGAASSMGRLLALGFMGQFSMVACSGTVSPITQAIKDAIVARHNLYRKNSSVLNCKAADMETMVWDNALQQAAENYAKQCTFAHPEAELKAKKQGENIYMQSPAAATSAAHMEYSVFSWWDEIRDAKWVDDKYVMPIKRDDPKQCAGPDAEGNCQIGHYTQVVWATTNKVGCAHVNCGSSSMVFCRYSPPANTPGDDAIKDSVSPPWQPGTACASCPNNCKDDMCTTGATINRCFKDEMPTRFNGKEYTNCKDLFAAYDEIYAKFKGNGTEEACKDKNDNVCRVSCGHCAPPKGVCSAGDSLISAAGRQEHGAMLSLVALVVGVGAGSLW